MLTIHDAVIEQRIDMVEQLLKEGVQVDSRDGRGRTPLFYAVEKHNGEIIHLLLDRGANVLATDNNGEKLLRIAVEHCDEEVTLLLLDKCDDNIDAYDKFGYTTLHYAVAFRRSKVVERY